MNAIDIETLSAEIAAVVGRRYRLSRLSVKSSYPVFKGETDGMPPIFVKIGRQDEWRRTMNLLRDVGPIDLFARFLTDVPISYQGHAVFVTEWREVRILYPENMSNLQADNFSEACVRLSGALQSVRDFVPLGTLSGGDGSTLGTPPEVFYDDVRRYVSRHPIAGRLLGDIVETPVDERTYGTRPLLVVHGDFHAKNFGFSGDQLSSVFDFEGLTQGLACTSLTNALMERFSCLGLTRAARMRLKDVTRRIVAAVPWPREELTIACNIVRLQFAARRIRKHPDSAWVAFDVWRRDRALREFLSCLESR